MASSAPTVQDVYQTVDPSSEKVVKTFPQSSAAEVLKALAPPKNASRKFGVIAASRSALKLSLAPLLS
jgi:hypothetical protein